VGSLFQLVDYPREDQNREYLVVSATHELESDAYTSGLTAEVEDVYSCSFTALDSKQPYRQPRTTPKPMVQGPQTAVVVGPAGEEIYTDKYGRVKIQFHWDRYGKNDENSSCWVRVASNWAGKGWGAVADSAHRPGGDRGIPGRRPGPAHHHRPGLQCQFRCRPLSCPEREWSAE
jgi:type VI secretion system secreted protein VgrG